MSFGGSIRIWLSELFDSGEWFFLETVRMLPLNGQNKLLFITVNRACFSAGSSSFISIYLAAYKYYCITGIFIMFIYAVELDCVITQLHSVINVAA